MAAKLFLFLSAVVAVIGTAIIYFNPELNERYPLVNILVKNTKERVKEYWKRLVDTGSETRPNVGRLLTGEELQKYDGSADSLGLYLALLGKVYDVKKGSQHYRPGSAYSFFAGKDATRAYLTGEFKDSGLTDDVTGLSDEMILSLNSWIDLYEKDYTYVGKLIGRYYDEQGQNTPALENVYQAMERGRKDEKKDQDEKDVFPPCNSEWSHESGTRVWCTTQSGGKTRDWVGVPRQLMTNPAGGSGKPRCACVKNTGPPYDVAKTKPATIDITRGDLDNPHLKEYPGCAPTASSCSKVKQ